MSRTARIVVGLVAVVLVALLVGLVYVWVSGGTGEASAPITAATLEVTEEMTGDASSVGELVLFNIVPEESEVRFILDEDLNRQRNTVTGRTDQIAGQIGVNFENPPASEVGEIRINARTLVTDNEFRNRAIRGQILQSTQDEYEFISFQPTTIQGLPATVAVGETVEFQVVGDLTIRHVTKPVTFDVAVTATSETRLEGTATATVMRGDFELEIPSVPSVANVSEEVRLEIDFVATSGN